MNRIMNNILKIDKHKILYILAFALLMSSIGMEPTILLNLTDIKEILDFILAAIRSIGPIFIILISLVFISKRLKKIKFDFTFLIIFTHVLCTIIGYFNNMDSYATVSNFENVWINNFLVLQSLSFFLLLFVMYNDDLNFNFILYSILFILFLIYSFFTIMALKELFSVSNTFLYTSDYLTNGVLFKSAVPRSSGIARIIGLFAIINIIYLFNYKLSTKNTLVFIFVFSILYFLMIILQARTPFYTLNVSIGLVFLISVRNKFWKNLKILFFIFVVLFFIIKTFPSFKNYLSTYFIIKNHISDCNKQLTPFNLDKNEQKLIIESFFLIKRELESEDCNFKEKKIIFKNFKLPELEQRFNIKNFDRKQIAIDLNYNVNTLVNDEETLITNLAKLENDFEIINLKNIEDNLEVLEGRIKQKKIILNYIDKYHDYLLPEINQQNLIYEFFKFNNREITRIKLNNCPFVKTKLNNSLTGRICHNYVALSDVGLQIFGKGARYDRSLLKWGASNTLVYSYISSGIIGIIFYLHICYLFILFFYTFIKNTFKSNKKYLTKTEILDQSLIFLMLFFLCRSIVEISFGYWSVDQLIFLTCLVYYKKKFLKKSAY